MKPALAATSSCADENHPAKARQFAGMLQMMELLHRRLLDLITAELGRREKALSSVQALILYHAAQKPMSLGEFVVLGAYEGTNLNYNIGKLAEAGYVTLARPQWDKRSTRIELTETGRDTAMLISGLLDSHAGSLEEIGVRDDDLALLSRVLKGLNRAWSG